MIVKNCLKAAACALAGVIVAGATGCGAGKVAANSTPLPLTTHVSLSGNVHGGQQPIYHSVIGLWAAGNSGYGLGATNLIGTQTSGGSCGPSMTTGLSAFSLTHGAGGIVTFTAATQIPVGSTVQVTGLTTGTYLNGFTVSVATSTATSFTAAFPNTNSTDVSTTADSGTATMVCATSSTGQFSITGDYTCPSSTTQVYLTASGGDPSGGASNSVNNTAIQMVAALGSCGNLTSNTFVEVNEVTTVAAAFALSQFYSGFGTTTDSIGTSSTNANGLINAFGTAANLALVNIGSAQTTSTTSPVYMTATDQEKLYTLANILSDCVNQPNPTSTCQSLFTAVTPSGATAPVNVFQAAVYMNLNPTSTNATAGATNRTTLFNMQSPYVPYATDLSAAPTDWTLALQYTGTGINYLSHAAVDADGDLWFSNASGTANSATNPGGVVVVNGGTNGTTGSVIGFYSGATAYPNYIVPNGTRQVAIDLDGNAWYGTFGTTGTTTGISGTGYYMFRATKAGTVSYYPIYSAAPYGVSVDPNNEVFATSTAKNVFYTLGTATSGTAMTDTQLDASNGFAVAITHGKVAYVATASGLSNWSTTNFTSGVITGNAAITSTNYSTPYGSAVDKTGRIITANQPSSNSFLSVYNGSAFSTIPATPSSNTCLEKPAFIAVDGNNNYWVTNSVGTGGSGTNYGICEFDSSGNLLSSSQGYATHNIANGRGIAVDLAGNVWVTSYGSSSPYVTQIVGVAAPTVAPIALAVANNTVGTKP